MSVLKRPAETLHFLNNMPIELDYKNTITYSRCKTYDPKVMNKGYVWHQVVVPHKKHLQGAERKSDVLDAIFEVVGEVEFYPIAYRYCQREDRFLVRQCTAALDKLFAQNLRIQLSNGILVSLQVQLNVGDFKFGQISPITKLEQALSGLFDNLECIDGHDGVLNLSQLHSNRELADIVVNLGNQGVFERICELVARNEKFRHIRGMILSNNGITCLEPLKAFGGVAFGLLDLRDNKLKSTTRLARDLKGIKANELLLAGNSVTKSPHYSNSLKSILGNFKTIDGIPVDKLSKNYTPMDYDVDVDCDGYRIDWTNKADVKKFQNSVDWHAILIPDVEQEFSKEEIFDYFFITISTELSDIYPCYYKYAAGEHQCLVRNCSDQLVHLVEVCNLEIKIPRLVQRGLQVDECKVEDLDVVSQVQIEKTLNYYLRMNISPFKKGQVEPLTCIDSALEKRFSAMDRLLNLDNFQETQGLENIIINLSSVRILRRVLTQASRKFLNGCTELRLSKNKILNLNMTKALALMSNLKALDLGNNWINSLSDIEDLHKLGLKSLILDGNPICSKYNSVSEYLRAVKQYFPSLQRLDNVDVISHGSLRTQKNFLCDVRAYDFVEQFVSHYFGMFSSPYRPKLREMYHEKALFTMNCHFLSMSSSSVKRLSGYEAASRDLYTMPDFKRAYTSVHVGADEICAILVRMPSVDFDMFSFATDTPTFNDKMIVITVHGLFMDRPSFIEKDILMAFTRTFVLIPVERQVGTLKCSTCYKIINEQFSIYNPTPAQTKNAFKYIKTQECQNPYEITVADKEALLIMLQEVTLLKSIWCTRCLEDAKWDFKKALKIFTNLCQANEIPDTAFI